MALQIYKKIVISSGHGIVFSLISIYAVFLNIKKILGLGFLWILK